MITLDDKFNFCKAKADGNDILLTDIDRTLRIPFWIESWDTTGQMAEIWLKTPTIPIEGTTVYLYYGNANPINPPPAPIEIPPMGPFTRAIDNPIVPIGDPEGVQACLQKISFMMSDRSLFDGPCQLQGWFLWSRYSLV